MNFQNIRCTMDYHKGHGQIQKLEHHSDHQEEDILPTYIKGQEKNSPGRLP